MKTNKTYVAITEEGSILARYQNVVVGHSSLFKTIYYEICVWIGVIPGAAGLFLRKVFWPRLFASCGKGVMFGSNVILRHPNRIHLGDRVVISEGCVLDARNASSNNVLSLEHEVILSNNVIISCKNGTVKIGSHTGLGANTVIQSTTNCPVSIGSDVIIGPKCYFVGGGSYRYDSLDIPIRLQGIKPDSGVTLKDNIWLGANVSVLGGVTINTGSIVAAGAVVNKSIPENTIYGGVPAKLIKSREIVDTFK